MLKTVIKTVMAMVLFVMTHTTVSAQTNELYFIDAHSQVDHTVPLNKVLSVMQQAGVSHAILSSRGKLKAKEFLKFALQHTDVITPAIRTKGKPYDTGSAKFYKSLKAQVNSGKFSAIAEVLLYHAKKGNKAPEYVIYPEDKRVLTTLEYAMDNHWPFVIHIEFGALHGKQKKHFMKAMEKMLDNHAEQPFVLTHMGQLDADVCQRLIENHKNIYFHTGWSNPVATASSKQPWVNLFEGQHFAPKWRDLLTQYPERFVFALDNVFAEHWSDFYIKQMVFWKKALGELPADAAHLIAHGNAERLWKITLKN